MPQLYRTCQLTLKTAYFHVVKVMRFQRLISREKVLLTTTLAYLWLAGGTSPSLFSLKLGTCSAQISPSLSIRRNLS